MHIARVLIICLSLLISGCGRESFRPFEILFSITFEQAVLVSVTGVESGVEMRVRVYPEDGEVGLGERPARDDTRLLTDQEVATVNRLFDAVDLTTLNDGDYVPPLDASIWAINTTTTGPEDVSVLEPGEAVESRGLTELFALGNYLWNLAGLEGRSY